MAKKKSVMHTVAWVLEEKDYVDLMELFFWLVNCFDDDRGKKAVRLAKSLRKAVKDEGGFK